MPARGEYWIYAMAKTLTDARWCGAGGFDPRPRAAGRFKTIVTRMELLWREGCAEQPPRGTTPAFRGVIVAVVACDMRLFSEEWNRRDGTPAPG